MKTNCARVPAIWLALASVLSAIVHAGSPVAAVDDGLGVYAGNPYYWQYHGRPVLLLGGSSTPPGGLNDEGMFLWPNLPAALDKLKAAGGNYVRCLVSGRLRGATALWPFARNGDRYDLDQWDEEYWRLFETFLRETQARDIITDIELWATFDYYREPWTKNPFNPKNNINYTAEQTGLPTEVPSHPARAQNSFFRTLPELDNAPLVLEYQQRFVDKALSYTLRHDHILYCMDNETAVSPKWGAYWARYVRAAAEKAGRKVPVTEMFDPHDMGNPMHSNVIDHPELYSFVEMAQNNHQKGETHYAKIMDVRRRVAASPRPLNNVKIYGSDGGPMGSSQEGMRRFWRNLFAGCASARFHEKHLGDSEPALQMIRSARLMTAAIDLFRCQPHNDLLRDREPNQAYCLAELGKQYAVYFPAGGSIRLDLAGCTGEVGLRWLDVEAARWSGSVQKRSTQQTRFNAPGPGQWIAVLTAGPVASTDGTHQSSRVERFIMPAAQGRGDLFSYGPPSARTASAAGPLRVHPTNPRYFTDGTKNADGSLKAVYLTGSHTWANLQDIGLTDPPPAFAFPAYLDSLERHHHNFVRLWRWEFPQWTERGKKQRSHCSPQPWLRIGPGAALDGKPKFNLERFDEDYFERLRARVASARDRGIYVSVMLFEGWGLRFVPEGWKAHPFFPANNVNLTDSDVQGIKGIELFSLARPRLTALQEAHVRKVIDTVNDLDNVLYEIANESDFSTTEWQYHMIRFIKSYESAQPKQHPVGMTSIGYGVDDLDRLLKSPADWISPNPDHFDYKNDPPAAEGAKVIILDTDHLWGVGGGVPWVWKSFLRGHNPIWMDPWDKASAWEPTPANAEGVRNNLGYARRLAQRVNLASMQPRPDVASTGYCLANVGVEYLVYQPKSKEGFSVELPAGTYRYEWFDPVQGVIADVGRVEGTGGRQQFKAPVEEHAVLYLVAQ